MSSGHAASGVSGVPRGTRCAALALATILVPGLLTGGSPLSAVLVFAFLFGWVWLPGCALASWLEREADELTAAAMGLVSGSVLLALAVFVARATGAFALLYMWPAAGCVFLLRRRARASAGARAAFPASDAWLFFVALVLVLPRMHTGEAGTDLLFHGGNAAELTRTGPLLDPRVAGRPLNYHLLAHTLPAAARVVTRVPIAELFQSWILGFHPLVLLLLAFVVARELAHDGWAGLVAALVLFLHHDLIHGLAGEREGFLSHLDKGLYLSPPTCAGLGLLLAQALVLSRWLDPERRIDAKRVFQLALLAAAASLAKGSVMPVAIVGAGFALATRSLLERRWLGAILVMLAAALPGTLWLSLGPGSYAGAMFRVVPFASAITSGTGTWLLARLPASLPEDLRGLTAALVWLPGFLGLSGVGALAWLAAGRPSLRGLGPWILGVSGAGCGAALLLLAAGNSQIYFGYDAHALLALPAGLGAVALWQRRRPVAVGFALFALPFATAELVASVRQLGDRLERTRTGQPFAVRLTERQLEALFDPRFQARLAELARISELWREGARWLRENTEPGALLVARDRGLMLTFFAERRVALSDDPFAPERHAARWVRVDGRWQVGDAAAKPFPELDRACLAVYEDADAAALARLRAATGHSGELYVFHDDVELARNRDGELRGRRLPAAALEASSVFERCFENEALVVYRVRE